MPHLRAFIVQQSTSIREDLIATLEELAPVAVMGTAACEREALAWMRTHTSDLAVIDIDTERGNSFGFDVLRAAHTLPSSPRLIVLTSQATSDVKAQCLSLGADRVFDKSSEVDALIEYCAALARAVCKMGATLH